MAIPDEKALLAALANLKVYQLDIRNRSFWRTWRLLERERYQAMLVDEHGV